MNPVEKKQAKDRQARHISAWLLAGYCLAVVFTSVPVEKNRHVRVVSQAVPVVSGEAARLPVAGKWWHQHQNRALARARWWQNHKTAAATLQSQQQSRRRTASLAALSGETGLAGVLTGAGGRLARNEIKSGSLKVVRAGQTDTGDFERSGAEIRANAGRQADHQAALSGTWTQTGDIAEHSVAPTPPLAGTKHIAIARKQQELFRAASLVSLPFPIPKYYGTPARNKVKEQQGGASDKIERGRLASNLSPVLPANQCVTGNIAGWSGRKPLTGFASEARQFSTSRPLNSVPALSAGLAAKLKNGGFRAGSSIFMRIFKDKSILQVWLMKEGRYALFHTYKICRWSGSFGPKLYEGDKQSPEGFYLVNRQLFTRRSWKWKGSFSIGYPNAYDKLHGRTGSLILVHGGCTSTGCFALTNPVIREVRELAQLARDGGQQQFHINVYPFELTKTNLARYKNSPWLSFWKNLKTGYDLFEQTRLPPRVRVCNKRYVFARADEAWTESRRRGKGCYGLADYIPGWKPAWRVASRYKGRHIRRVGTRCNLRRASCRKWLALRRNRKTRRKRTKPRHYAARVRRHHSTARRTSIRRARAIGRKHKTR